MTLSTEALACSKGELACFDKVDAKDFVPREVKPRFRILRGERGCKGDFSCYVKRARPSRKVLQVFLIKRPKYAKVNFGNLGWARQNVAIIPDDANYLENALLIARGVEWDEVGFAPNWVIEGALEDHNLFVEEVKCIRQTRKCKKIRKEGGLCEGSFNEVQPVPGWER